MLEILQAVSDAVWLFKNKSNSTAAGAVRFEASRLETSVVFAKMFIAIAGKKLFEFEIVGQGHGIQHS